MIARLTVAARAASAAALFGLVAVPALAQGKRPAPAALIAAAKATNLADFEAMEELRGLTVEAWASLPLKQRRRARIAPWHKA